MILGYKPIARIDNQKVNCGQPSLITCSGSGWPVPVVEVFANDTSLKLNIVTSYVNGNTNVTQASVDKIWENTTLMCSVNNVEGVDNAASNANVFCK